MTSEIKGLRVRPYLTQLKRILVLHGIWIVTICVLGGWWGTLLNKQANRIVELERLTGLSTGYTEAQWQRTHRMVVWESSVFFLLLLLSSIVIYWLYIRDLKRSRGIEAFFASFTHELKTPLTSIRLQAEALADQLGQNSKSQQVLNRLMEDTSRLESQVEKTLELARLEGGGPLYTQAFSTKILFEKLVRGWKERNPTFDIEVQADLSDIAIMADLTATQLIVKNILENAVRHAQPTSTQKLYIKIRAYETGNYCQVIFSDNGRGTDLGDKKLGSLFEKGMSSSGTGVGLYLIKMLMETMQGKAAFANDATGFTVNLSFRKADENA